MKRMIAAVCLGCVLAGTAAAQPAGPAPGVFTLGQARFTILAAECIRIEYSTKSLFVDAPSLFAMERGARYLGYSVEQSTGRLVLDTGRIQLTYTPDGWPLSVANLKAEIRLGPTTATWTPELNGEGRLDAARSRDWVKGHSLVAPSLLSRAGWRLVDDSNGMVLKDGRAAARPAGHGTDWFLFGYGLDFKAGLRALTAVSGSVPLARKSALDPDIAGARFPYLLRSVLFPYAYSAVWQAYADSLPLLRSLYIEYPEQEESYRHPQEYLYGDSFLVAPIVSKGRGRRKAGRQTVWFPEGDWYDWFTGQHVQGPAQRVVEKDPDAFPLYVKGGVPLVMQPVTERPAAESLKTLVLRAYPGPGGVTGRAALYEDDGASRDYLSGGRALTNVSYLRQGDRVRIKVDPTEGSFKGQLTERAYAIELPGGAALHAVLDGKPTTAEFSAREKLNRISIPARDIRQGFTLYVWLP